MLSKFSEKEDLYIDINVCTYVCIYMCSRILIKEKRKRKIEWKGFWEWTLWTGNVNQNIAKKFKRINSLD